MQPRWRRDGRELYYLTPSDRLMAVDIKAGTSIELGIPTELMTLRLPTLATASLYDVAPDGRRFVVLTEDTGIGPLPATVVLNWTAGLKR